MACKASWLEHLRISGKPRRQITTSKKALHIQPLLGLWPQIWRALLLSFQPGFANPWVSASTRLPLNLQWKQPNTILKLQDWVWSRFGQWHRHAFAIPFSKMSSKLETTSLFFWSLQASCERKRSSAGTGANPCLAHQVSWELLALRPKKIIP